MACDVRVQVVDLSALSITFDEWSSQLVTAVITYSSWEGGSILLNYGPTHLCGSPAYYMNYSASQGPSGWQGTSVWAQFGTEGFLITANVYVPSKYSDWQPLFKK
jgi:hypothetical protein